MTHQRRGIRHGTFNNRRGDRPELEGKGALLQDGGGGNVTAQFDDQGTGLGLGWFPFFLTDFDLTADPFDE